jgi:hypothetical protein
MLHLGAVGLSTIVVHVAELKVSGDAAAEDGLAELRKIVGAQTVSIGRAVAEHAMGDDNSRSQSG